MPFASTVCRVKNDVVPDETKPLCSKNTFRCEPPLLPTKGPPPFPNERHSSLTRSSSSATRAVQCTSVKRGFGSVPASLDSPRCQCINLRDGSKGWHCPPIVPGTDCCVMGAWHESWCRERDHCLAVPSTPLARSPLSLPMCFHRHPPLDANTFLDNGL
ncbi:hypothetical protein LZ30DRAFT_696114, partial [Colletotrichum cereale]